MKLSKFVIGIISILFSFNVWSQKFEHPGYLNVLLSPDIESELKTELMQSMAVIDAIDFQLDMNEALGIGDNEPTVLVMGNAVGMTFLTAAGMKLGHKALGVLGLTHQSLDLYNEKFDTLMSRIVDEQKRILDLRYEAGLDNERPKRKLGFYRYSKRKLQKDLVKDMAGQDIPQRYQQAFGIGFEDRKYSVLLGDAVGKSRAVTTTAATTQNAVNGKIEPDVNSTDTTKPAATTEVADKAKPAATAEVADTGADKTAKPVTTDATDTDATKSTTTATEVADTDATKSDTKKKRWSRKKSTPDATAEVADKAKPAATAEVADKAKPATATTEVADKAKPATAATKPTDAKKTKSPAAAAIEIANKEAAESAARRSPVIDGKAGLELVKREERLIALKQQLFKHLGTRPGLIKRGLMTSARYARKGGMLVGLAGGVFALGFIAWDSFTLLVDGNEDLRKLKRLHQAEVEEIISILYMDNAGDIH